MFRANCFKHKSNTHLIRLAEDLSSVSVGCVILESKLDLIHLLHSKDGDITTPAVCYNLAPLGEGLCVNKHAQKVRVCSRSQALTAGYNIHSAIYRKKLQTRYLEIVLHSFHHLADGRKLEQWKNFHKTPIRKSMSDTLRGIN